MRIQTWGAVCRRRTSTAAALIPANCGSVLLAVVAAISACAPPSSVSGVKATSPMPGEAWTPPRGAVSVDAKPSGSRTSIAVPSDLAARAQQLSLGDVIDLALRNSPQTGTTWAQARSAAAVYGASQGKWLPSIDAAVSGGPAQSISQNPARIPPRRSTVTAALSLQYTLLDFGARSGLESAAREGLYAADFTHNSTLQSVVLQSETAYFTYQASRGLLDAARKTLETAQANLAAADRRHEVGLATIADVLQARTALAQTQLNAQTAAGNVQSARAQLALALGLDANAPFDVVPDSGSAPVQTLAENVDSLIARAVRSRPDVAAARALAQASSYQVRATRSAVFPSITLGSNAGRNYSNIQTLEGQTYLVTFGLSVPLFNGFSRENDVVAATENASAAAARAEQARLQAVAQVFSSYYALQTATQRVSTAADLLASAARSEEVAEGRYAEGVGSILDLLTSQSVLADARAQSVQSRWTWYAALAQLSRDAGVLGPHGETNLTLTARSPRTP